MNKKLSSTKSTKLVLASALLGLSSLSVSAGDLSLYRGHIYGNHFYTTDVVEMLNAKAQGGYVYDGITLTLVTVDDIDANKPLYRLYNPDLGPGGDHFYTSDLLEALNSTTIGYTYQKTEGYTTKSKAKILYRAYSESLGDHFYTADVLEMLNTTASGLYRYEKEEGHGK